MISLFLNTSSSYLSVAILKENKTITKNYKQYSRDLSKMAVPTIKKELENANITADDIEKIYVVSGPGSFTGLRVGVTIAKTYACFKNKELYPMSSLYAMAASIKGYDYIIPVIDARRDFVFAGIYDKEYKNIMNDQYISLKDLKEKASTLTNCVFVSEEPVNNLDTEKITPDYDSIIKNYHGDKIYPMFFVPNYLKKTQAEENLNK